MKGRVISLLTVLLVVCIAFGFAGGAKEKAVVKEEKVTLSLGTSQPDKGGFLGETPARFKQYLVELSGGRVDLKVHYGGSLSSNERELAEMVQSGSIDFSFGATTYILGWTPSAKIFDLPYLFTNVEHFRRVTAHESKVFQQLQSEIMKNNVQLLGFILPGFRSIFNNKKPIYTPEDCAGLKIRSMQSPVYVEMFKALGMLPTPMPASELYAALQTGVVDAGENDPASVVSWGWVDVIKYYSLTQHTLSANFLIMNKKKLESFNPELQKAIIEAGKKAIAYQLDYIQQAWEDSMKIIRSKGVQVNNVKDVNAFRNKISHMITQYDKEIGYGLVDAVLKMEPK